MRCPGVGEVRGHCATPPPTQKRKQKCDLPAPPPPPAGCDPEVHAFHEETRVTFSELSDELVREYVDSGEPM